jgi:hypothetical protein
VWRKNRAEDASMIKNKRVISIPSGNKMLNPVIIGFSEPLFASKNKTIFPEAIFLSM